MTCEQLHDAISLLPADLIAEADRKRSHPRPPIRWQRFAAMAACFLLVLGGSYWCLMSLGMGSAKEAAAEAPAAMQSQEKAAAPEEAMIQIQAAGEAAPAEGIQDSSAVMEDTAGESANTTACQAAVPEVTVSSEYGSHTLAPEDRANLAKLLSQLTYRKEDVCECIAEITVTVNGEETFRINLEEGFVRCEKGQAKLTQAQIDTLREIIRPAEED